MESVIKFLKKWTFSLVLIFPIVVVTHQFWLAIARNILMAVNYSYPGLLSPLLFVLDTVTLIIHEGGHTIFGLFQWRFLTILGGSLLQLLIPFLILASAWWNRQQLLTQFAWFWLGFSWMDTAAYCADAKYRDLPLIGNLPKSAHDFNNMLSMTGLIDHYRTIAWFLFAIGFLCFLAALLWPLIDKEKADLVDLSDQLEKAGLDI